MSWNGSDNEKAKAKVEGEQRKDKFHSSTSTHNFNYKALLAGLIVVIGGGLAAYLMLGRPGTSAPTGGRGATRPTAIAEVAPAVVTNAPAAKAVARQKTQKERDEEFIRKCEAKYGDNMPAGLKTHIYYLKNPPKVVYEAEREFPYLKNEADRGIAGILYTKPGTFFIDCPEFNEKFDKAFVDSLVNPLRIEADDTDESREVKAFVNDMKHQIADVVKRDGVKPSELMNEQARMLYDLGRFEAQLATNLREAEANPDLTDDDVRDMFAAANELRKKKGLEERAVPKLTGRALAIKRRLRQEARKAAKKAESEGK